MDEDDGKGDYRVFLLRLWRAEDTPTVSWRCSLEDPSTHARRGFEDVAGLISFLSGSFGQAIAAGATAPPDPTKE